jgi:cephalosporin-C deacetylase-like acetyl esterase
MKRSISSLFIIALFAPSVFAQRGSPIQVSVMPDHENWLYMPGEPANFTVKVTNNGANIPGASITYTIGPEMMPAEKKTATIPESGVLVLDGGTMKERGFLRCIVTYEHDGVTARGLATGGFSPEKIKPTQTEPPDFDEYWSKAKAELAKIPFDVKLTPMPQYTNEKIEGFEVNLQNVGTPPATTSRFYGILCIPRGDGPFPALMSAPGAGVRGPDTDTTWAERGFITLKVGVHEMPIVRVEGAAPTTQVSGNYPTIGLDDRDHYYFRRVFMGLMRANDYLVTLPKWDHKNLVAFGGSQGGFLAIVTAGLDPRVTACNAAFPAYCDVTGYVHGRAGGWPTIKFDDMNDPARSAKIATTAYFDAVNFARRIKVPCHFGWGYNDETCPPDSTFSMYNVVTAPKELDVFPSMGHPRVPELTVKERDWVMEKGLKK